MIGSELDSGAPSSTSADGGGEPLSLDGSSGPAGPAAAADGFVCTICEPARSFQNKAALISHQKVHPDGAAPAPSAAGGAAEQRPRSGGKRGRWGRRARTSTATDPGAPPSRPRARRVSTAPLTSSIVAFAAGGLNRIGQQPLAMYASFTAPVAGEIVDEAVAGTVVDKLVQPLVRGSEKYQNVSALFAGYAAVAWASNNPEQAPQAYALFRWSMTVILPLAGKEMAERQKAERKAAEALADILPDLKDMGLGDDPIQGLWQMMWAAPPGGMTDTAPAADADTVVNA